MSEEHDRLAKAVQEFYYYRVTRSAGGFMTALFNAIFAADDLNKLRLSLGFPMEVKAWFLWNTAGDDGNDLFREFGLMKTEEVVNESQIDGDDGSTP